MRVGQQWRNYDELKRVSISLSAQYFRESNKEVEYFR